MISGATTQLATPVRRWLQQFREWKSGGGILLVAAAAISMLLANSRWHHVVDAFWESHRALAAADVTLSLTVREWISDGLMASFFLLVGLEIKREVLEGELSTVRGAALPLAAAFGGMVVPAMIYLVVNPDGVASRGWPVPMATDIAFALGVLSMLGSRIPPSLTVFLTALAIADDLGAVVVIGFISGHAPDTRYLLPFALTFGALMLANRRRVASLAVYAVLGIVLWYIVLRLGLHPTLAGILIAFTVPSHTAVTAVVPSHTAATAASQPSPLARLEHMLHSPVNYCILPLFALANAGVPLAGPAGDDASAFGPVAAGVTLGLIAGKPLGILVACWLATRLGAALPSGASWLGITGIAILAGIGFTMSLFMSQLVFGEGPLLQQAKLGIVCASVAAALAGATIIMLSVRSAASRDARELERANGA